MDAHPHADDDLVPELEPGTVHLTWLDVRRLAGQRDLLESVLSPAERERAARYATPELRDRFALVRGVLRRRLGRYLGRDPARLAIDLTTYDQPVLSGRELGFSVSHARHLALLAFALEPCVGVDVAWLEEAVEAASISRWLPDLPAGANRIDSFRAWTLEEARRKAAGVGFGAALPSAARAWPARTLEAPVGFVAALVTEHPSAPRWVDAPP